MATACSRLSTLPGGSTLSDAVRSVGETVLAIRFETDPEALAERLPAPLELLRPGEAFCYIGEAVIRDPSLIEAAGHLPPRLSTLFESMVVVPCELDGREGCFFTGHHADRDWSTRKFRSMGYATELADIRMTRFPPELREFAAPEAGRPVEGRTSVNGRTRMWGRVRLESKGEHPWPFALSVFGRRRLPDDAWNAESPLLVDDVTTESQQRAEMERVWCGEPELQLGEAFDNLKPVSPVDGVLFDISLEFEGMSILWEGDRH